MTVSTKVHLNGYPNFGCCGSMMMHDRRSCYRGFGIVPVLVGSTWLAAEMGRVAPDLFRPVVLLALGMAILTLNRTKGIKTPER
jgi:hypothetical protein